jgi:hypothetical protein
MPVRYLIKLQRLIKYAEEHQYISAGDVEVLKQWRENPQPGDNNYRIDFFDYERF